MATHKATIEEVIWKDVKDEVKSVNQELYRVIEDLKPTKNFTLFKARYPYGANICDYGIFNVPCEDGTMAPISSDNVSKNIRDKLSYNPMPVALILKNNVEVFSEFDNRFIPIELFTPGTIFGTWEIFDAPQVKEQTRNWSFNAGGRSIFILPKLTNDNLHRKLHAKYDISPSPPRHLSEQYNIFKTIVNDSKSSKVWENEIIFFPRNWISNSEISVNNKWVCFRHLLLKEAWKYASNWRYQLAIGLVWRSLSLEIDKKHMRTRPYLVDTIKHLISIAIGTALGFCPAVDSDSAPIGRIQDVYIDDYGLDSYIPTVMQPSYLRACDEPVYYSLQHPTLLAYPQNSGFRSTMKDLQEVQYLMDTLLYKLKQEDHSIYELIKQVKFDYFHSEPNTNGFDVKLTTELPDTDDRFLKLQGKSKSKNKEFASNASFLRGCVRITKIAE